MRFKYFFCAMLMGMLISITSLYAQTINNLDFSKVKSSQLSDTQITEYFKKFQSSGYSEEEGMNMLIKQGLDPYEANILKKRLEDIQSGKKANKNTTPNVVPNSYSRDTTHIYVPKPIKKPSVVFGSELFSNPNLKFEPNIRIATPQGYVLGADDQLNIIFTGLNERVVTAKISPEGNLQIPNVGLIYLNGMTIEQAANQIKNKSTKIYPALATGQTKVNVTLGTVKSIRVSIIGEVAVQGTYTLSSLSSLFNALYESGGPTRNGSLRNIELIRGNKVAQVVDLYSYIQTGIMSQNVRLQDQDVIKVPVYTRRVAIDGEVRKPGLYELKNGETISDLVKYTSGFSDHAYKGIAKVSQIGEKERSIKDVPADMFDRYVLRNADSVYFGAVLNRYANRVNIEGAVYRPGQFELSDGITLRKLIQKADGIQNDASLENGYIKRTNPNLDKEMISFNLGKILSGAENDISLIREDTVVIVSRQDLKDNLTITIGGNVRNAGILEYRKGMSLLDALSMANGFTYEAASHRIEISRLIKDKTDLLSNNLLTTVTINLDSAMRGEGANFLLEPLDYIYIPRLVNYRSLGAVSVKGEVLFPGDYPLKRRDETALEFIQRAGGITPVGAIENAQIFRNGVRVGLDLTKSNYKKNVNATVLIEGDSIFIPKRVSFVEVEGAVNTPQLLSYESTNFNYYINAAGGTTENARLKNAYVKYPNGTNQPVKKFLFFKNYPPIVAGSKIVVPENKGIKVKLGIGEISAIASALTALVTVIAILVK